jgi:uncharacterized delta-60 repeat protein
MKSHSNEVVLINIPVGTCSVRPSPKCSTSFIQTLAFITCLYLGVVPIAFGAAGDLDTTFAGRGTARLGFGGGLDYGSAVAVQADGKVVVAGNSSINPFFDIKVALVRYMTNNLLDPSFGEGGKVSTVVSSRSNAPPDVAAVQIQKDGKIVVTGTLYDDTNNYAMLLRYNPDGSLDTTFGVSGIVTNIYGQYTRANAMLIQPDGRIVIGGQSGANVAVARYTTNGILDSSFAGAGFVVTPANGGAAVYGLTVQSDGKIIGAGTGGFDVALIRYTTSGALDTTFGPDHTGKVFTHIGAPGVSSSATAVAIEPGDNIQTLDRIVIAGNTEAIGPWNKFLLARYKLDGSLDSTLAGAGTLIDSFTSGNNLASALLIQGTGTEARKIIVTGSFDTGGSDYDFGTIRYNDNGALDLSFGAGGKITTSFGTNLDLASGMSFVGTNKFLIVGSTTVNDQNSDFAVARYNLSNGSLDTSFDADGKLTEDIADRPSQVGAIAIQTDGKIVLAGSAENGENSSFVLSRFHPDGTVDMSFARFGKAIVRFGGTNAAANAVAIQPDGKIVAAGSCGNDFAVVRFATNGALDGTFNGSGIVTTPLAAARNSASGIVLQADGKIVIAGYTFNGSDTDFAVLRYNTNGPLDSSFGGTGKVITAIDTGGDEAHAVKIQTDGKIVVAGAAFIAGAGENFAAVRYNTNGTLDNSFGLFGRVAVGIGSGAICSSLAIQPDGKIVAAGFALGINLDIAVVRFDTNGMLDSSFNGNGKVTTPVGLGVDYGTCLALQPDGKIIVGGATTIGAHYEFVAVRYQSNGILDSSYGLGGKAIADFADNGDNIAYALAMDSNGRAVLAGSAGGFFGVARLQSDPALKILSINKLSNGHVVLTGIGVPGATHTVQGLTSLRSGSFGAIGTVTADGAGHWQYDDAGAVNQLSRCYRLAFP